MTTDRFGVGNRLPIAHDHDRDFHSRVWQNLDGQVVRFQPDRLAAQRAVVPEGLNRVIAQFISFREMMSGPALEHELADKRFFALDEIELVFGWNVSDQRFAWVFRPDGQLAYVVKGDDSRLIQREPGSNLVDCAI